MSFLGVRSHYSHDSCLPFSPHRHEMGKCCPDDSDFIFDRFFIKLAYNKDRHKISDELAVLPLSTVGMSYLPLRSPMTLENIFRTIAFFVLIELSSDLLVMRIAIKSWTSLWGRSDYLHACYLPFSHS